MNRNTQIFLAYLEYKSVRKYYGIPVPSFLAYRNLVRHFLSSIERSLMK